MELSDDEKDEDFTPGLEQGEEEEENDAEGSDEETDSDTETDRDEQKGRRPLWARSSTYVLHSEALSVLLLVLEKLIQMYQIDFLFLIAT